MVFGTPNGHAKMTVDLTRYADELTGFIMTDDGGEPIEIAETIEEDSSFTLYFNIQGYDVNVALTTVDENNLKSSLLVMFDTTAKRIVEENDFFVGNWMIRFIRTPNDDAKMTAKITRKGGGLQGKLIREDASAEPIIVSEIVEEDEKITLYFTAQGYD
jgi:hypothetical protein